MISILTRAVMMSTPLLLGSIAEVFAERTGMMVTAIEGIFLMGAWGGFIGTFISGSIVVGLLTAVLMGFLMALLYAFITVYLRQQQIVVGTAMNILAGGICAYFQRVLFGIPTTPLQISVLEKIPIPILSDIPVLGEIFFEQNILTYIAYLVIPVSYIILFKTSLGLAIRVANTLGVTISWLVTDHDDGSRKADTQQLGALTDSMLEDMQKITKDFSILRGVQKKALILHAFSYLDYDPFTMDCRSGGESEEKGIAADTAIAHDIDSIEPLSDEDVKKKINSIIKRLNEEIDRKGMTKAEIGEKLGISLSVVSVSLLPDSTRNTDVLRMLDYIDAVNATPEMILDGLETTYSALTKPQRQARDIMLIANTDMTFAFRNCLAVLDEDEIKAIRVHAESYL